MSRRPVKRPFFPVAEGIEEHFSWLRGGRLLVFLLILKETRFSPTWEGWTVAEIGRRCRLRRQAVSAALHELAMLSPTRPRRRYIELRMGRGRQPNRLRVLRWVRQEIEAEPELFDHPADRPQAVAYRRAKEAERRAEQPNRAPEPDTEAGSVENPAENPVDALFADLALERPNRTRCPKPEPLSPPIGAPKPDKPGRKCQGFQRLGAPVDSERLRRLSEEPVATSGVEVNRAREPARPDPTDEDGKAADLEAGREALDRLRGRGRR